MSIALEIPTLFRPSKLWQAPLRTPMGRAYAVDLETVEASAEWRALLPAGRRDHRFHAIVERTIQQGFEHSYLVLEDHHGRVRGIQPFFVHAQDLLGGSTGRLPRLVGWFRKAWPSLLTMRTLMVGSPVGEGLLGAAPEDADWCAQALAAALKPCARRYGASLVVMKEFSASLRPALAVFAEHGFARIPSMPYVALDLNFADFEQHMRQSMSHNGRKDLRRKFRDAEQLSPITMEVLDDISDCIDELYPLYLAVYERAKLRFERLTPEFFCRLGQQMPETTRFFVWRQQGRAVAFSACTLHDDALYDEYLGLDYSVAMDAHLYFCTLRDVINWCCREGIGRYYSTALNYAPKLHLRFQLAPVDLYVRHANSWINAVFKLFVPMLNPTRGEPVIRQFPNADQL